MQTTYKFDPAEDLTVLDLAEILDIPAISQADFDKLPERLQRHFKAGQVFDVPTTIFGFPVVEVEKMLPKDAAVKVGRYEDIGKVFDEIQKSKRGRKSK